MSLMQMILYSDDDGLNDGNEVLYIPRPWQSATNPLVNDTDQDGMLDGWEMQVQSTMDNTQFTQPVGYNH